MCGLAGLLARPLSHRPSAALARAMADRLAHRGPDDSGIWTDETGRIALAHRRLAIHDLSTGGRQPMPSTNGRYIGVFNGAIHNFRELQTQLEQSGFVFRSTSDTEVMLAAVQHWGFVKCLDHLIGMFAIAVWDGHERKLYLARDRVGQKPLYYGRVGNDFAFASELKAFLAIPEFDRRIDPLAVQLYLNQTHVPSPYSIYRDISKLPPGHYACVDLEGGEIDAKVQPYWRRSDFQANAPVSYEDATREAEALLTQSVADRVISDVPLGAFLSGGFDSTAVVALMQEKASRPVHTFTVTSPDPEYDESSYARQVARYLGTEHTEFRIEGQDALDVVDDLPKIYDEPFADSSQVPMVVISRLTRQHVTVALTGDGGDEVFGGYNRHVFGLKIWRAAAFIPVAARRGISKVLGDLPSGTWNWVRQSRSQALRSARVPQLADKIQKIARALPSESPGDLYRRLVSCWATEPLARPSLSLPRPWFDVADDTFGQGDVAALMMYLDFVSYLADGVLVKVDRATMSVALEARTPFLDYRLAAYMAGLPTEYKVHNGISKRMLRDIVYRRVPRAMVDRPKTGFDVPIDSWLRGPLKGWATDLLDTKAFEEGGLFDVPAIARAWQEHQSGAVNRHHELWCILMFQSWMRHYRAYV